MASAHPVEAEYGETKHIRFNRPVKYRIDLESGTWFEGIIPASTMMSFCVFEEIKFNIIIDDDYDEPWSVIEADPDSEPPDDAA